MCCTSVFMNGGSQAVRIPAVYRFSTDRVSVEVVDGGILLRPIVLTMRFCRKRIFELAEADCDIGIRT